MKICVDLDGTICENLRSGITYKDVKPLPGAVETLEELKQRGYYIVISTARNMRTCNNNLGRVIARQGKIVFEWLEKYGIPYDEVLFGKPHVDYFIDDKGIKFTNWKDIKEQLLKAEGEMKDV
jgi:capsule biosynthesis phosphatase